MVECCRKHFLLGSRKFRRSSTVKNIFCLDRDGRNIPSFGRVGRNISIFGRDIRNINEHVDPGTVALLIEYSNQTAAVFTATVMITVATAYYGQAHLFWSSAVKK